MWRERANQLGWALLPLRLFLGVTMVYASLDKLLNPAYLDPNATGGVKRQMELATVGSPISSLVSFSAHHATLMGLTIAFGELAVGLGLLLGLFTRLAAFGGVLLSLSFLLTVSWTTRPYFYGPDIAFLFAFTPLVLAGDGGVLSWQTALRRATRRQMGLAAVPGPGEPASTAAEVDRRTLVRAGVAGAGVGVAAILLGTIGGAVRRRGYTRAAAPTPTPPATPSTRASPTPSPSGSTSASPSATPTATAPPGGTKIGSAGAVPVGSSLAFTDPTSGGPAYVVQPKAGTFLGFSAVCTHEGCQVTAAGSEFSCPCHGARFSASRGDVTRGPARTPLARITIVQAGGDLYAV